MSSTLALVAVSARMMAEAAVRDGYRALAVDLFGDADTRRAASAWWPGGDAATLQLDTPAVLAAAAPKASPSCWPRRHVCCP